MSGVVDQILISGLQDFEHHYKLNPVNIKINDNQIISSLSKYGKYLLKITSLIVGASFNQITDVTFIICNWLKHSEKALINGKMQNILGVINLTEETNFNLIKNSSKWLNIILMKAIDNQNTLALR